MLKDKISVIIINYNGMLFIERLVKSLNQQSTPYDEVIVFDNNSYDESEDYFLKNLKKVTLLKSSENIGFAKAVNIAVSQAKNDLILVLNNDTYLEERFIERCLKNVDENGKYHFFTPLVLNYTGQLIDSAGDSIDRFVRPFKNLHLKKYEGMSFVKEEKDSFSMSIAYFKKDKFLEVGGLDERFFMYFEDVDFSLRLKKFKYNILFTPDTIGYHLISGSTKIKNSMKVYSAKKVFWEARNRVFLFNKNYDLNIISLFFFLFGTILSSIFHIFKTGYFYFYLKGFLNGLRRTREFKNYG